jgi:hypothetical protein
LGFKISQADNSLIYFSKGQENMFILVCVDNIIVASSSSHTISALLDKLGDEFALKDQEFYIIFRELK